jgi:hypothetical protein
MSCPFTDLQYSSSVSKSECPASVWATITAEAGRGGGGGSGAAPTGGARSGSENGAAGLAGPMVFSGFMVGVGVLALNL